MKTANNQTNNSKLRTINPARSGTPRPLSTTYKKKHQPTKDTEDSTSNDLNFYKSWAHFVEIMQIQPGQNSEVWANHLLSHLIPFVEGFQATLYIKANQELHYMGGYAVNPASIKQRIKVGDQTIGQVAKSKETLYLKNPQSKFVGVNTQQVSVHSILTLPALYQNETQGVLEILFYKPIAPQHLKFLHRIASNIGVNLCLLANAQLKQQNEELNEQLDASEEFRKLNTHLRESLCYASNIQSTMMPSAQSLQKVFKDYFLIYQPKDIVSGDFYWVTQLANESNSSRPPITFIAVVDCTGHGVPGAFMSIIGTTLLNEIVNNRKITDPDLILKMLNSGVRTRLKQSQDGNKVGMDVCLCKIEKKFGEHYEVTFAGAKRPLYYTENKLLQKLKGDRHGIGGDDYGQPKSFTQQQIMLQAGDRLFLSTDGFKDAANPNRKSLGQKKLEQLLYQGNKISLSKHRQLLLHALESHQQGTPQRDDVTLMGIQL